MNIAEPWKVLKIMEIHYLQDVKVGNKHALVGRAWIQNGLFGKYIKGRIGWMKDGKLVFDEISKLKPGMKFILVPNRRKKTEKHPDFLFFFIKDEK